ncbi:MAG: SIS domain-containing protein [Nitrososphaerales archaeon]
MLTPDEIKTIDKSGICDAYDKWPLYCKISFGRSINLDEKFFDNVNSIVFSGMGGSGTTGDILADWLRLKFHIPTYVMKGYHIPAFVNQNTLFIAMSVSGNTEETLAALLEATSANAKVAGISQGGEMEKICGKKNIFHIKIEQRILPRITLPELLYSALKLLTFSPFLNDMQNQIDDSIQAMVDVGTKIRKECRLEENPAKQLAKWIFGKIPAIYCSPLQRGVGIRFKNSVNENAKINAIAGELLDSCHNELVSWGHTNKSPENAMLKPLLLRSKFDPEEVKTRFDVFKGMLENNGYQVGEIPLHGSTPLANIITSLYMLDYAAIYLGILKKTDPTPITPVFVFKDEMKKRLDYFTKFIKPELN